jgi:hypothetical protein
MNLHEKLTEVLNGTEFSFDNTFAADGAVSVDGGGSGVTFANPTTDKELAIAFGFAAVKWVVMWATAACTIETNAHPHSNTFSLLANKPLVWKSADGYFANPFTVDVTKMYLSATAAGSFFCYVGLDATP